MAGFGTATANKILDHALSTTAWTIPAGCYISLHTADPGEDGSNEATGGGYGRQGDTAFDAAASAATDNTSDISFTNMPAGTFTHVGIWDAVSSGNFIGGGALSSSVTTGAGDTITISAGNLDVSLE